MNFNSSFNTENFAVESSVAQIAYGFSGSELNNTLALTVGGLSFNEFFTSNKLDVRAHRDLAKYLAKCGPAKQAKLEAAIDEKFYPEFDALTDFGRTL